MIGAALFAASAVTLAPAFALDTAGLESLTQSVVVAKVVEVPAVAAKLVRKAEKADKEQVAVAVVTAAIKAHPSSIGSVITAVIRSSPQSVTAVVKAALAAAPDSALTIVAAAAEGAPDQADKAVAEASKVMPSRTASFEREVAVVRGRQLVNAGAGFGSSGDATSTNLPVVVNGYATAAPGSDPNRP